MKKTLKELHHVKMPFFLDCYVVSCFEDSFPLESGIPGTIGVGLDY